MEAGGRQKHEALGAGIGRGKLVPEEFRVSGGRVVSRHADILEWWLTGFENVVPLDHAKHENCRNYELSCNSASLSNYGIFNELHAKKKKSSPNNVFLLLFFSFALLQHVGIPHTFL